MVLVLAALFLGEPLTWQKVMGGGLIAAGTIVIAVMGKWRGARGDTTAAVFLSGWVPNGMTDL